jgi:HrpA-like RNA helicase
VLPCASAEDGQGGRKLQAGVCYKLYMWQQKKEHIPVPEIIHVMLESVSLAVKAMQAEEDVCSLFAPCGC